MRRGFAAWLAQPQGDSAGLFGLLNDRTRVSDDALLPKTGVPHAWERVLSSPFVLDRDYGTRASTVLLLAADGAFRISEQRFDASGQRSGETEFELKPGEWP